MKDLNELQAMNKDLLKHTVELARARFQWTIVMKDRTDVLNLDRLSTYGQDDLPQSVFVAGETPVELELENHFLH